MKLIDLLGPLDPTQQIAVFIDPDKDKYDLPQDCQYKGAAVTVPALLTKIKVTEVRVTVEEDKNSSLEIKGVFTNEEDSDYYRLSMPEI